VNPARSAATAALLDALAYSNPGFGSAIQAVREKRAEEFVPAEHVIPGWADRQ
jgi:hypothetical protein